MTGPLLVQLRPLILVLATALATGGCYHGLDSLKPFPCAKDGSCPNALTCVPDLGCADQATAAKALPYGCNGDGTCAFATELALQCVPGVGCATQGIAAQELPYDCLDDGITCPYAFELTLACVPDLGCSDAATAGDHTPFPCFSDETCAFAGELGLQCVGGLGCATVDEAQAAAPFACNTSGACAFAAELGVACVPDVGCRDLDDARDALPYACNGDGSCAFGAELALGCVPGLGCATAELAVDETPYACSADGSCVFAAELDLGCVADVGCTDADGARAAQPFACLNDTCPTFGDDVEFACFDDVAACLEANTCDVVGQTGCGPAAPKCAPVSTSPGLAARCVADGTIADDTTQCTRSNGVTGVDDCVAGRFCSVINAPAGEARCRTTCDGSTDCDVLEVCSDTNFDVGGICVPPCAPLELGGCLAGSSCKGTRPTTEGGAYGQCIVDGVGAEGDACDVNEDCNALLECRSGTCTRMCNGSHDCGAGFSCPSTDDFLATCECTLFFAGGCQGNTVCSVSGNDTDGYQNGCAQTGAGAAGDPCDNGCASGLCFTLDGTNFTCTDICDAGNACPNSATCAFRPNEAFGVCPN